MSHPELKDQTIAGRYQIKAELGAGGMATVYLAFDPTLNREVAIKRIHPHRSGDENIMRRFEQEASAIANLDHPNIITVFDFINDNGTYFMILQLVDGNTLEALLENKRLSLPRVIDITVSICDALAYAHQKGIIHRDIKPSNVMITRTGQSLLMDFGIAKIQDDPRLTSAGDSLGTPLYMSPEQIRGRAVDGRTDIYAMGVMLFEMVTGRRPFQATSRAEVKMKQVYDPLPNLRRLAPELPDSLVAMIEKATAKEPAHRFQTVEAMRDALQTLAPGQTSPPLSVPATAGALLPQDEPTQVSSAFAPGGDSTQVPPERRAILYDPNHHRRQFLEILETFTQSINTDRMRRAAGPELVAQISRQQNEIQDRLSTDFTLVIAGHFKRGKSTFINALLGQPVVTTDVTPETVTINEIRYGPTFQIKACLSDGGQVKLAPDELKQEKLTPLLAQLPQPVTHLAIEAPVNWLQGLCLVDTPGTDDIFQQFDEQVQAYLAHADAVVWVVSALSPFSETERAFLKLAIRPRDFPKLTVVVNKIDELPGERDTARVLNLIQARLGRLFSEATVFGLSARDEFYRLQNQLRPNPDRAQTLAQAFADFRAHLQESILFNRDLIQLDRAITQAIQMVRSFEANLGRLQQAMDADQHKLHAAITQCQDQSSALHRSIEQHKQETRETVAELKTEALDWLEIFMKRLERETLLPLTNFKFEDVRRHFHFFLVDTLNEAVHQCLDAHRPLIIDKLNNIKATTRQDLQHLTNVSLSEADVAQSVAKLTFGDEIWTNLDTTHLLLAHTQTSLFGFVGPLLLQQLKKVTSANKVVDYQQQLHQMLPELRQRMQSQVETLYDDMAAQIEQQIETAFRQDVDTSLATLQQAQAVQTTTAENSAAVRETLEQALALSAKTRSQLEAFKQKLWPQEEILLTKAA